jgi:predicted Zn-dependent protease
MTVARYCPFCAAAAESDWIFCQSCGKRLPGATVGALDGRDDRIAETWQRALRHVETNDFEDALRVVDSLMDLGCDAGDVEALLGSISLRQARIDEAQEHFDRAVAESPYSPFVRLKRAEYWRAIGIPQRGIDELTEGLRHAESERVRDELRKVLEKMKKDSRWNFPRASPFSRGK